MRSVKIIYKDQLNEKELQNLINEISLVDNLTHPNIMKHIETFCDDTRLYLVMDNLTSN